MKAGLSFNTATGRFEVLLLAPGQPSVYREFFTHADASWFLFGQRLHHVHASAQRGEVELWQDGVCAEPPPPEVGDHKPLAVEGVLELERNVAQKRRALRAAQLDFEAAEQMLVTVRAGVRT